MNKVTMILRLLVPGDRVARLRSMR